jgi:LysM repeat protein
MKWKDSDEAIDKEEEKSKGDYFDEEQYSPWSNRKDQKQRFIFGKIPLLVSLLAIALIASLAALTMLLLGNNSDRVSRQQIDRIEERVRQLEDRMDNYKAIDEKVTLIWEQAKTFEKFRDRFDRSEASTSLRMDHLTMSLEALQKQVNEKARTQTDATAATKSAPAASKADVQYHRVVAGDTLYSISKRYNLSVEQLLKINGMDKNSVIQPGQKLIVRSGVK